jgi:hypothetical protein
MIEQEMKECTRRIRESSRTKDGNGRKKRDVVGRRGHGYRE